MYNNIELTKNNKNGMEINIIVIDYNNKEIENYIQS